MLFNSWRTVKSSCGFSPSSPNIFLKCCCYICHRAINSKANRLHIRCRITSTSFQSITTFIYLKVQILTAFLFHSLHHVALRITLTSITCLPLQGLSTVNSVCPLSSQDSSSLNSNSPSQQH